MRALCRTLFLKFRDFFVENVADQGSNGNWPVRKSLNDFVDLRVGNSLDNYCNMVQQLLPHKTTDGLRALNI